MAVTSYCSVADVQMYFANTVFGENSAISSAKVSALIANTSALVNTSLNGVYELPVTAETDLAALKGIVAKYVAGEIDDIQTPVATSDGVAKKRTLKKEAQQELDNLIEKKKMLKNDVGTISIFEKDDK